MAVAGRPVRLTPTEYELLFKLSVHAGRVLTHDQLLQRVWEPERTGEPWLVRLIQGFPNFTQSIRSSDSLPIREELK